MVFTRLLVSLAGATLLLGGLAGAQAGPPDLAAKAGAEIWYTEQFVVRSKIVGRDFLIQVAKPPSQDAGGKSPAVYVLDGNATFGLAANIMQGATASGAMAPAFIIGVGYPSQRREDWQALRGRDLTFVRVPPTDPSDHEVTGEAMKFQRFLTEELRPLIEARYPVNRAMLAGHSYGGLFAAHVLLNDPRAFDGYLIGSPSVWAEPALLDKAMAFIAPEKVPVFISVGAKEAQQNDAVYHMVANMTSLAARLTDHASNLDVQAWVVPDENHTTVKPAFLARALQFALPPPSTAIPAH
jgi:predicted alpha/beta superfamily hydrolase